MPARDFYRALSNLVGQGGSQRSIIAAIRSRGFKIANDRIRGLINQLRGRNVTERQRGALARITVRTEGKVSLPTAIVYRIRITARYAVERDEFGRSAKTLLSGTVTETQTFKLPLLQDNSQRLENQAAARIEEEVLSRVRSAGLAQAGNYITPSITNQTIEVLSAELVDFR